MGDQVRSVKGKWTGTVDRIEDRKIYVEKEDGRIIPFAYPDAFTRNQNGLGPFLEALGDDFSKKIEADVAVFRKELAEKQEAKRLEEEEKRRRAEEEAKKREEETRKIYENSLFRAKEIDYGDPQELTDEQEDAVKKMESGQNVFLTGKAGTGKSYVVREFLRRNRKRNILVCAPTGVAAINIGGATLHRTFGIPIRPLAAGEYNRNISDAVKLADTVIIDEISMCRFDVFEYVMETLSRAETDLNARHKQVIVVGDFFQLEPVLTKKDMEVLYASRNQEDYPDGFAFHSPYWDYAGFEPVMLKNVMRQAGDSEFTKNLNRIRMGDAAAVAWFNGHAAAEEPENAITLCGTNDRADEINQKKAELIPGQEIVYQASVEGEVKKGDKLTTDELSLKVGMQVMTLVNDSGNAYQNGSIGTITGLYEGGIKVLFENGEESLINQFDWEIVSYEVINDKPERIVVGHFRQIPVKIAYAITVHKSQGQTYDKVNISPDFFANGQLYVALSRARSIDGIHLDSPIRPRDLKTSKAVKELYGAMEETG